MMKRVGALLLTLVMVCVCLSRSAVPNKKIVQEETPSVILPTDPSEWETLVDETPVPPTPVFLESDMTELNILIIGNSHSIDAFHLLYETFMDQYPDLDLTVGILHFNGCSISEHATFGQRNSRVYRYLKNDNGRWNIQIQWTMKEILQDVEWDVVMIQPAKEDLSDPTLNLKGRTALKKQIDKHLTTPYSLIWHVSWPSPNDETFFSPDYVRQPPVGYKDKLTRLYGFDPVTQYSVMIGQTRQHILNDPTYFKGVCSGTAVMQAYLTQGVSQLELWRDYTHLSDYGRLMVGYALVAQLTGRRIESVGINVVSKWKRHYQNRHLGNMKVTEEMKETIIESANYTIAYAWEMPPEPGTLKPGAR